MWGLAAAAAAAVSVLATRRRRRKIDASAIKFASDTARTRWILNAAGEFLDETEHSRAPSRGPAAVQAILDDPGRVAELMLVCTRLYEFEVLGSDTAGIGWPRQPGTHIAWHLEDT